MPKNRLRHNRPGAKSLSIQTKNKIGGRKSGKGTFQMTNEELENALGKVRKKDRNKLRRQLEARGLAKAQDGSQLRVESTASA